MTASNKPKEARQDEWDTARAWKAFEARIEGERAPDVWSRWDNSDDAPAHEERGIPYMEEERHMKELTAMPTGEHAYNGNGRANGSHMSGPEGPMDMASHLHRKGVTAGGEYHLSRVLRLRRWAAGAAACAALYGLLATSWGDRALAAMMQTFRIQHMVGIDVTSGDLSSLAKKLEQGSRDGQTLDIARYGTVSQTGGGPARDITLAEAGKLLGTAIPALDAKAGSGLKVQYVPESTIKLKLNVSAVNHMIRLLGGTALLPQAADGRTITVRIPAGVLESQTSGKSRTQLAQFGTPELTVEDGIDPETIRKAVLELPLLPQSMREKLAAIDNWRSTLPVPNINGVMENISLDGRDAVIARQDGRRYLMWLDGGQITTLSGDESTFPTDEAIMEKAKELLRQ